MSLRLALLQIEVDGAGTGLVELREKGGPSKEPALFLLEVGELLHLQHDGIRKASALPGRSPVKDVALQSVCSHRQGQTIDNGAGSRINSVEKRKTKGCIEVDVVN